MSTPANSNQLYAISVALYGGPLDPNADTDENDITKDGDFAYFARHVGVAVHTAEPAPKTCYMHHARCPDTIRFMYDPRPEQHYFAADPVLRGRCDLVTNLTEPQMQRANQILEAFGADGQNLSLYGQGNCHDFMANAVCELEKHGLAGPGHGQFWVSMVGQGPVEMSKQWSQQCGPYVKNPTFGELAGLDADAKWSDKEAIKAGKLNGARGAAIESFLRSMGPGL